MIKRISFSTVFVILFTLLLVQGAMADQEIILKRVFTSVTPVFMEGHDNDPNWIEGFDITCNILLDGNVVGTCSGENRLINPPLNLAEQYQNAMIKIYNDIPGTGTFEATGISTSLGSQNLAQTGDVTFSFHISLSNGTGNIEDIYGWSGGCGSVNIFAQTGGSTEVLLYRFGF
jgi:hypothetical protein